MGPDSIQSREDFGAALTEVRVRSGLSVRDVAAQADALVGTVAGWFAGHHAPTRASREMFERVLEVCGVDADGRQQWWAAVERLSRRGGRRRTRPEPPYRGFASFGPEDRQWYFGRDDLVDRLVDLVATRSHEGAWPAVMVVGASGVGKSSLVRAGLIARVREDLPSATMVPGTDPVAALESALATLDSAATRGPVDQDPPAPTSLPVDSLAPDQTALTDETAPESVDREAAGPVRGSALLIVDQMEEFWTQSPPDAREEVNRRITELLEGDREIIAVGVLRADFYARAAQVPWMASALESAQVVVTPMDSDALRTVIVAPAKVAGAEIEPALVDMLVSEVAPAGARPDPGVLPLLSHALRATWDESDGRRLTVATYLATGRIAGAVEQTAEQVYAALDDDERAAARQMLLSMVNVDEEAVSKRTVDLDDLESVPVLERFAAARMVTITPQNAHITHEALLTAWPRLVEWITEDRERLLLLRRLRTLSAPWEENGRPDDLLPSGTRLALFSTLSDGENKGPALDKSDRDFLEAGTHRHDEQVREEARRRSTLRRFAIFAGALALVAVMAAVVAVASGVTAMRQRDESDKVRNEALSRQVAVQSADLAQRDPHLAAQLAMIAYDKAPTVEARSVLVETMSREIPIQYGGARSLVLLARTADGEALAAVNTTGELRLFAYDGPNLIETSGPDLAVGDEESGLEAAAFLPDGRTLLVGGQDALTAWQVRGVEQPRRLSEFPGVGGAVRAMSVSPDGRFVVAAVSGPGLQAWREVDGAWQPYELPIPVTGTGGAVAFSPDGTVLATSSDYRKVEMWRVGADIEHAGTLDIAAGNENNLAEALAFAPDGRHLAIGLRTRTVDYLDVSDPAKPSIVAQFVGFESYVTAVAINADGTRLGAAASDNRTRVFDIGSPAEPARVLPSPASVSAVAYDGSDLITGSDDGRVQVWRRDVSETVVGPRTVFQIPADDTGRFVLAGDTENSGRITQWAREERELTPAGPALDPPSDDVFSGALASPGDGSVVAAGSVSGTVYFADFSDRSAPRIVGGAKALPTLNETVDYSPVSGVAVTGALETSTLTIIDATDVTSPTVASQIDVGAGVWWASLSPNGQVVAVATKAGAVRLIDVSDPVSPSIISDAVKFPGPAMSVRFDHTGNRIVATSEAKTVAVVDISDPTEPRFVSEMAGPAGQLYSASFSPNGILVAAGGANSEIWVWRVDSGETLATLRSMEGTVYDVRFIDGGLLLSAGGSGSISSWVPNSHELVEQWCTLPGDRITEEEWRTYLPTEPYDPPC